MIFRTRACALAAAVVLISTHACTGRESDTTPSSAFDQEARNAIGYVLWPDGEVPFEIHSSFRSDSLHVITVMRRWEEDTPIRFVPRTDAHGRYVHVVRGGCKTETHNSPGAIKVSAGPECVGHELGHSLGLTHEHQRPDRDQYITVDTPWWWLFGRGQYRVIPQKLCRPYDLGSVMHYEISYLQPLPGFRITRQDNLPTELDLLAIRQLYGSAPCQEVRAS